MVFIETQYFKIYRQKLGFNNQKGVKNFFAGRDIIPTVDFNYLALLNNRLVDIIHKVNELANYLIKVDNLNNFCKENIDIVFKKLKENNIITKLNNQGRRPEQVYF